MKKFFFIFFLIPVLFFGQNQICDTIYPSQNADTIIYCVTNASCHEICDGSLTIDVRGPNQPYSYSWTIDGVVSPYTAGDNSRDSLCANQYIVSIIDANGDIVDISYVNDLFSPPNFTLFENSVVNPSCFNGSDGLIDLTIGGATPPYSFLWSDNGSSTLDRNNLEDGVYILTMTDLNNCQRVDTFTLVDPSEFVAQTLADTLSCIGLCDGVSAAVPLNGTGPFSFLWSNGNTDSINSNLCYGNNSVIITDFNGCSDTNSIFVSNPDTLKVNNINVDSSCYQICDGQISISLEGGMSPYSVEWKVNGIIINTSDTLLNNLCPNNYELVFSDANNCIDSLIIPLIERDSFIIQSWVVNDSCYNSCTGEIRVQLLNSIQNQPILYSWNNGSNDSIISNLCAGSDTLEIIDSRNCRDTFIFIIEEGDSMYISNIDVSSNLCFNDTNGVITVNHLGGVNPFIYTWSNGLITTGPGISNLSTGYYSVNIRDQFGCTIDTVNIEVSGSDSLFITPSSIENVSCFGSNDGLIDLDIFGGVEPYFISWDNQIPDSTLIDSVPAGSYVYTIVDSVNCVIKDTIVIEEPDPISLNDSIVNILCKNDTSGQIHLFVSGGISPYQFSIDNGATYQNQNFFDSLLAGNYSFVITDDNNCQYNSQLFNIDEPLTSITLGLTASNLQCFGDTGSVNSSISGGTPPYSYIWNNGFNTQNLNSVSAGTYSLTVIDNNNCELVETIEMTQPNNIDVAAIINDLLCFEDNSGSINITPTGGTLPYSYVWSNGSLTQDISSLDFGTYSLQLADDNGCQYLQSYNVAQPDLLNIVVNETNVLCFGESNGSIDVTINGGTSPYSYTWSNGLSSQDLFNLPLGNYDLDVTDLNNCNSSISVEITEPQDILVSVSTTDLLCNSEEYGQINILVSGGVPGYLYSIDNESTYTQNSSFINLSAGNYNVWVQDLNGCKYNELIALSQPIGYSSIVNIQNVTGCNGSLTGAIELEISGNTPPYTYNWSNNQSTSNISNLAAGNYELLVSDVNNCNIQYSFNVAGPNPIVLSYDVQLASCEEKNDGAITTNVSGGIPPYSFSWGTGESSQNLYNLSKGIYSLFIEDSEGCSIPIEIIEVGFDGFNGCIEVPSGFTPNNDNVHDEWVIYGLSDFPNVVVKIYNRWGQEIFSSIGYDNPWDGKYNGSDLPIATYYYVIELNESDKVLNGTVTIKR